MLFENQQSFLSFDLHVLVEYLESLDCAISILWLFLVVLICTYLLQADEHFAQQCPMKVTYFEEEEEYY